MANTTKTTEKTDETKKVAKMPPKKIKSDELIECRSVTAGKLIMIGPKTGMQYNWEDYGDICWVEYQDLLGLQSRRSTFLTKPRFIIENDDVVEMWAPMLKPIYDKITSDTLDELFNVDIKTFRATIAELPKGIIESVKTRAVQLLDADELYDIRYVKAMDEIFGTDFVQMFVK